MRATFGQLWGALLQESFSVLVEEATAKHVSLFATDAIGNVLGGLITEIILIGWRVFKLYNGNITKQQFWYVCVCGMWCCAVLLEKTAHILYVFCLLACLLSSGN